MVFTTEQEVAVYVEAKVMTTNNWKQIVTKMLDLDDQSSGQKIPSAIAEKMRQSIAANADKAKIKQVRNRLKTLAKKSRLVRNKYILPLNVLFILEYIDSEDE
jgi:hypothetical protein